MTDSSSIMGMNKIYNLFFYLFIYMFIGKIELSKLYFGKINEMKLIHGY